MDGEAAGEAPNDLASSQYSPLGAARPVLTEF